MEDRIFMDKFYILFSSEPRRYVSRVCYMYVVVEWYSLFFRLRSRALYNSEVIPKNW